MTLQMRLLAAAALGSAALLAGAFLFQALGWAPCKMCLWQRWPHVAALTFGALIFATKPSPLFIIGGAVSALTTSALGAYHSGVELKWWEGPTSCTGTSTLSGLSGSDLLPGASNMPDLVMCDTLTPFFAGLTMANWNMIASAGLTLLWIAALLYPSTTRVAS